ncbi:uncharacterized protein [Miscanthus floridulus]|uniref:uncharacterized protein n=1 Tax=Miscanthus floridulus TaxID=154761 RepID=UPI00345B44F1
MDTEVMPLPPPPLRTRVAVAKRLPPRSSQKRPTEVPTLAPLKALKVNLGSTAHWVAEAQAALHRGAVSARADPKEPATQGGAAEAALTQEGEAAPPPHDGEAHGSDAAEVLLAVETTGTEVLGVSQAEATEATAPRTIEAAAAGTGALATDEATMAEAGAPQTTEATMAKAGASGATDADVIEAGLPAQEVEMKAAEALAAPLVEGLSSLRENAREVEVLPISSDDTSRAQEMADAEVAGVVDQPAPTPGEGSSTLARGRPEPHGCNHPHVLWQSRDDPKAEPLFALEDAAKGELEIRSLGKSVFLHRERDVWDQLRRQKGLLAGANELLSARSAEVEDLRLQLGSEASRAAEASWVEAQRLKEKAEASRAKALRWKEKAKAYQVETRRWEQKAKALHTGVKRALAVIASHYVGVNLQAISDGYVLLDDDDEANEVVTKLLEAAEGPGTTLATLFEEEVVPPPPSADARSVEP